MSMTSRTTTIDRMAAISRMAAASRMAAISRQATTSGNFISQDSQRTSNSSNSSSYLDQMERTSKSRPILRDQMEGTSNSRPILRDQMEGTSNSRPILRDQMASTNNSRRIFQNQTASTSNSRPILRDQVASTSRSSRSIGRDQMASTSRSSRSIGRDQMASTSRSSRSIGRDQMASTRSSSLPVSRNQRASTSSSSSSSSLDQVTVATSRRVVTGSSISLNLDRQPFRCPVCLEVLKDPVTIPCGHSYCLACIEEHWEGRRRKGVASYNCPQCKHAFIHRPGLHRNTVLAELVENLQKTEDSPPPSLMGPEDVECDVCTGRKNPAVRSCLVCLASYCKTHLQQHEDRHQHRLHRLTSSPQQHLQDKVCPRHDRLLSGFCWTDRLCVCSLCLKDRHQGHETVSAAAGRTETQSQLEEGLRRGHQRLNERERELQYIIRSIKRGSQAAVQDGERVFDKLQRCIEKRRCEVMELIREQENNALRQAQEQMERLERADEELRWRDTELERLSHTKDHIYFLQRCPNLPKSVTLPNIDLDVPPSHWIRAVRRALEDIQKRLQELCNKELTKIADLIGDQSSVETGQPAPTAPQSDISDPPEPITRADFLQYCSPLVLDVNTANPYLWVSEGRREATTQGNPRPYPDHPDRFTSWAQVLCGGGLSRGGRGGGLTGRCYWEVEWSGQGGVSIGVCYRDMKRHGEGDDSKLGHNPRSWSLDWTPSGCSVHHADNSRTLPVPGSNRVGVYLDHRAGTLSFYSISSDTMALIYQVQTTFTKPLYPGFWVGLGSTITLLPQDQKGSL
ncbi:tripartite motif-containing protein 16-like isoform X2 [Esox lucius]|uniref:tripartite motif-containing protein 16-like isoform X2 n=1 Tax=Esox lucius TaxID=8010 RepID=UPI0010BD7973|nr:tripartite motif-containing protein 16-like isoform X2 [Esox lucius]